MAKRNKQSQVAQGGININGNVTINNSKIAGRDNVEKHNVNIALSFAPAYQALQKNETLAAKAKKNIEDNVKQIEQETSKGEKAKGSFIMERLENIQRMAPDIADVVIATLQSPAAGISLAVKKVVAKIQAEKN